LTAIGGDAETRSVCPSGAARATFCAASMSAAPGWFSTTDGLAERLGQVLRIDAHDQIHAAAGCHGTTNGDVARGEVLRFRRQA
jgi:hypothetical protein